MKKFNFYEGIAISSEAYGLKIVCKTKIYKYQKVLTTIFAFQVLLCLECQVQLKN